ncbi:hypothetical protein DACRYDRAFT_106140 [Dacryopinax primogenitus]|uniref:Uncharacterized protein n=1 Tax=Dacryopinax primogenitus (strain DJM 731) TaxID=1858805 RepID=M5GAI4_DACPD|nr:uncharacterized protein DACRYDRAFT_106140 [Dacryopinax primogenitus]EJU02962.1 hypothetical protein DACRYDRAFT_106140 [Dacryopinax primogenitus]
MDYRPSPGSIPLPLSNPLSPVAVPLEEVNTKPQTLIGVLPSNVKDFQDLRGLDLELLRQAIEDDASSAGARSIAGDERGQEAEVNVPQQTQEAPIPSSTVPTGDSLFNALRSPSLEPVCVASTSSQSAEQPTPNNITVPVTESSGELSRLMARYPMMITVPGSAPHKPPVRAMSHESFMSAVQRGRSTDTGHELQASQIQLDDRSREPRRALSSSAQVALPSSGSRYSDVEASSEIPATYLKNTTSAANSSPFTPSHGFSPESYQVSHAENRPQQVKSPQQAAASSSRSGFDQPPGYLDGSMGQFPPQHGHPEVLLVSRQSSPPQNGKLSMSLAAAPSSSYSSISLYDELKFSEARNEREREALERELAQARREADELERQCEELGEMMRSLGLEPPAMPEIHMAFRPGASVASSEPRAWRSPLPEVPTSSPRRRRETQPQTRTVSYHKMNGEHLRPAPEESPNRHDVRSQEALEHAARTLSIPISVLSGAVSQTSPSPNPYDPQSLDDVVRAMDFLRSADSLIWKGRRDRGRMAGRAGDSVYAEENVQALKERLDMWERAVRSQR